MGSRFQGQHYGRVCRKRRASRWRSGGACGAPHGFTGCGLGFSLACGVLRMLGEGRRRGPRPHPTPVGWATAPEVRGGWQPGEAGAGGWPGGRGHPAGAGAVYQPVGGGGARVASGGCALQEPTVWRRVRSPAGLADACSSLQAAARSCWPGLVSRSGVGCALPYAPGCARRVQQAPVVGGPSPLPPPECAPGFGAKHLRAASGARLLA